MTDGCGEDIPLLPLLPLLMRVVKLADTHKQYGMTKQQMIVLLTLYRRDCATMGEIAQYMSSPKEQATRVVASLFDDGLVERFEIPENRTHVYVRLSDNGRSFMKEFITEFRSEFSMKLRSSLSSEEVGLLHSSVKTAIELLSKVK